MLVQVYCTDMRTHLDSETQDNISKISDEFFKDWGKDGVWASCNTQYTEKTVVQDRDSAFEAFMDYTDYFNSVLESWSPSSDSLVLVPCGSSKPIGSSTIHQKKVRAINQGGLSDADIVIVSEPCTVVPPEYRLSLAAANYDFPPQYTVKEDYPDVFELFTDRLAEWLDEMDYDTIYPYLISGHQTKFDCAMKKMDTKPSVHTVPSASYNPETGAYSGDRFKTLPDMIEKVKAVCSIKANESVPIQEEYKSFYQDRFN